MDILRTELLESQKNRTDLHRWKMIVVSALAATALGFTSSSTIPNSELILSVIPLVCAYVDLLYYHDGIVINILGSFLRYYADSEPDSGKLIRRYEEFTRDMRDLELGPMTPDNKSAYQLEKIATFWSSIVVSGLVCAYPIVTALYPLICTSCPAPTTPLLGITNVVIGASGIAGGILTVLINRRYRRLRYAVRERAERWKEATATSSV